MSKFKDLFIEKDVQGLTVKKVKVHKGNRRYSPLQQPTAQQVLIEKISDGPVSLFVIGAHTNIAIFFMTNPHLKKNIDHIYIMGGNVKSKNPTGCCPENVNSTCEPQQCGDGGNIFTGYKSNPYAEFNIFGDPFAAYQVIHSGIPITIVPLDATNTIPITQSFFEAFERNQHTYEAQYAFKSLKMVRDTWPDDQFYESCFMWDSFMSGVATSVMRDLHKKNGENEFAVVEYMNITVVTSNKPYGISDGSNSFFDSHDVPKFNLTKNGVHSGHVQTGIRDPFCLQNNGRCKTQDGYTERYNGPDSVRVRVATRAKQNRDKSSSLNREFFVSFLDVIHSGIPITIVPLDATNTIPITQSFFEAFERNQHTYEAQYAFKSLKMVRDTWPDDQFYESCFMWDSFMSGVATSVMRDLHKKNGENEFAVVEYMNITVVTSNKPYGISDGSNSFFDSHDVPKFNLTKNGVHSGHVQTGIRDPFCLQNNGRCKTQDGYTERYNGPDSVRVRVATRAKQNRDKSSSLNREFFVSFLDVLNRPQNKGRFNFTSQFSYYKEVLYKPDFGGRKLGKTVVFDMDMSAGDFLALFYLLKVPVETINLKAILVTPTGWANAATIDVIYDLLHMMGRDDIIVGLGDSFGLNQSYPNDPSVGNCKYSKAIPHGSGGLLDSDTLFGLARDLPRSPRRFNFTSQFSYYKEVLYKPDFGGRKLGKTVVFDMDMSAGDFLALFYLLKVPVETINLKAILVTPTGWANAATIDVIYDLLHMMGRDDIIVGLGDSFGLNQSYPNDPSVGNCKYSKAIPHGSGGLLDSDTLFGLARDLPRSPRRYTAENSVEFGAPRTTDFPHLRQPLALEVWKSIVESIDLGSKITILTNGPLTTLAKIILADTNATSIIQDVFIVGGNVDYKKKKDKGNIFNVPINKYAELNMFLDPLAAKVVFDSMLDITLIPLGMQRKVCAFPHIIKNLDLKNMTPEAHFSRRLLRRMYHLQGRNHRYRHMDTFFGEILGAVILGGDQQILSPTFKVKHLKVHATGLISKDGQITIETEQRKSFKVLDKFDHVSYYDDFAERLADEAQSAVIGSFHQQKRTWSTPHSRGTVKD
ncbi:inosine/uridine-preferring nucleoside hydrolase domain-containing protein [Artemisia annua]|uniref:Inosine/uridine-preferring nucleoside hydrolase domain-containing protein n=1 Tax=Artemisia annua TaxID=35608 RepID=A0A2U1LNM6_ARTAN|nr:inosine/uridine-preferring nucleoside hydrolase domain-containing protein [Artemisia annua]